MDQQRYYKIPVHLLTQPTESREVDKKLLPRDDYPYRLSIYHEECLRALPIDHPKEIDQENYGVSAYAALVAHQMYQLAKPKGRYGWYLTPLGEDILAHCDVLNHHFRSQANVE